MYLETSDRRSLFQDRSRPKNCFLSEGPVRKDSAACVSLSSYSLVKQPGSEALPPPFGRPKGRRSSSSDDCRMAFHCSSEELQRRVIAAKRGGRRRWVVYRGKLVPVSTEKNKDFATENPGTALLPIWRAPSSKQGLKGCAPRQKGGC